MRLAPFTQGELRATPEPFIDDAFAGHWPEVTDAAVGREAYAERLAAGGYPAAVTRAPARRDRFFESYVDALMQRDLSSIARVHDQTNVRRLLSALAATSASLLNFDGLSRDLGIAANTSRAHASLLETLFLVSTLEPWSHNLLSRVVKTAKAYVTDTGLLCFLIGADAERIAERGEVAGMVFETFVVMEVQRQAGWHANPPRLFHYRNRDGREVDLVLERRDGSVVGIEVKTAASVSSGDLRGLRYLRDKLGDRFKCGIVLYTGEQTVPFEDRLAAVPLSGLWSA